MEHALRMLMNMQRNSQTQAEQPLPGLVVYPKDHGLPGPLLPLRDTEPTPAAAPTTETAPLPGAFALPAPPWLAGGPQQPGGSLAGDLSTEEAVIRS